MFLEGAVVVWEGNRLEVIMYGKDIDKLVVWEDMGLIGIWEVLYLGLIFKE